MYKFKAPYDKLVYIITWSTILLMAAIFLIIAFVGVIPFWFKILVLILFGTILYLTYAYSPLGFEIRNDSVTILRKIKPVIIKMEKIQDVRVDPEAATLKAIRFGSGGLFGFFGTFYSSKLKFHKRYVTCRKNAVLIVADKKYVITPDKPDLFVQLLPERIKKG